MNGSLELSDQAATNPRRWGHPTKPCGLRLPQSGRHARRVPAAEDRLCSYTRDQRAELWCGPVWGTDLLNAMQHLDTAGGGMFAPVRAEAEKLVREHWDAIERVAEALIERGELTGDEVDALVARPEPH
jgi:hypothetical protein